MSRVLVVDTNRQPLSPCTPARARLLLREGKAAVLRRFPFVLILKAATPKAEVPPLRLKIDPGSQTTGLAVVNEESGEVVWAAEISHRGEQVQRNLTTRRGIRRSRRQRHTRYRPPRWRNRRRASGWLPPSLLSRIRNVETWVERLSRFCPISAFSYELVRFDTQLLQNPNIEGLDYQRGTLFGIELRHYLLAKWHHRCAYCLRTGVPLELDHVEPKARGGSDRLSNRVPACHACNQAKADTFLEAFLTGRPEVLSRIQAQRKAPLQDAAAVNATRFALYRRLQARGLSVETGTGALTKWNRQTRNLPKAHWLDAACCGRSTPDSLRVQAVRPWLIEATGRQARQMVNVDKHGFPRGRAKGPGRVSGFKTGDLVRAVVTKGKKVGTYVGRVAIKSDGYFKITGKHGMVEGIHVRYCVPLHRKDGYDYQIGKSAALPPHD
jgi:hypothetical protein